MISYSDYSPCYQFNGLHIGIRFKNIENPIDLLLIKHLNLNIKRDILASTVSQSMFFNDKFRFEGIENDKQLEDFIVNVEDRIIDFVLPFIKKFSTLEKVGSQIKTMSRKEQMNFLGGFHFLLRRLVILSELNEWDLYYEYKEETEKIYRENIRKKKKYQKYLDLLLELTKKLEKT